MKPILILLLSFYFTITAFVQQNPTDMGFTNKAEAKNSTVNGWKEGKWMEYMVDDITTTKDSTKARFYRLAVYNNGKIQGITRAYYVRGPLKESLYDEATYVNGQRNGITKYYRKNKILALEIPYTNGEIINGVEKFYDTTGILTVEIPYINGRRNGVQKVYYGSGKILSDLPYTNGEENGVEKIYYESGKLKSETLYTKGVKGVTKNYDEKGNEVK